MKKEPWDKKLLDAIWGERMTLCYKMLLICKLIDSADTEGRVSLRKLAEEFQQFFRDRNAAAKKEDNPNRFKHGETVLSDRSVEEWERTILDEPITHIKTLPIRHDEGTISWDLGHWQSWSAGYKLAIKKTAEVRLIEYFEKNVPGGY